MSEDADKDFRFVIGWECKDVVVYVSEDGFEEVCYEDDSY